MAGKPARRAKTPGGEHSHLRGGEAAVGSRGDEDDEEDEDEGNTMELSWDVYEKIVSR